MNSTKLLLITSEFPPQPGGIGNHAYHLAKELQGPNQEVSVLTDIRSDTGEEEKLFDTQLDFFVHRIKRYRWLPWTYFIRMLKSFQLARSADLIILSGKFSLWVGGVLDMFINRPIMVVVHGTELKQASIWQQRYTNHCLKKFDAVIAVSNFTLSLMNKIPLKRVKVINNGFEIPSRSKSNSGESPGKIKLITVGNLTERKGQHNVISALPMLKQEFPEIEYHLVGIPTLQKKLYEQAERLGVVDHVIFHGRVTEEEKEKLLSEATIFIMLSETTADGDVEGFGIAILEANHIGLPAIGSKGCGIEDAIKDGYSGFLVDNKSSSEVVDAVSRIFEHYDAFSFQAKSWSKGFVWKKVIAQYQEQIDNLIEEFS